MCPHSSHTGLGLSCRVTMKRHLPLPPKTPNLNPIRPWPRLPRPAYPTPPAPARPLLPCPPSTFPAFFSDVLPVLPRTAVGSSLRLPLPTQTSLRSQHGRQHHLTRRPERRGTGELTVGTPRPPPRHGRRGPAALPGTAPPALAERRAGQGRIPRYHDRGRRQEGSGT